MERRLDWALNLQRTANDNAARLRRIVGGGSNKAGDRETMFSQLAKRSARQRCEERAGKFSALISPVSAARVQC